MRAVRNASFPQRIPELWGGMFRLFHLGVAAGALLLGSCSTPEIIPPEDVNAVIRSTARAQLPPPKWRAFLQNRTIQLVSWEIGGTEQKLAGGGLAAMLSADGYALTAAHVVDHNYFGVPVVSGTGEPLVLSLRDGKQFAGTSRDSVAHSPVGKQRISVLRGRLVHRFPGDLALVKLPLAAREWFEPVAAPPAVNDVLWMAWNPLVHARNPGSAGKVLAVTPARRGWKAEADAQMLLGDSGAAVIDASGRLVGSFTAVRLISGDGKVWGYERSMLEGLPAEQLHRRMAEDRATG